jgi:hypothetical protein
MEVVMRRICRVRLLAKTVVVLATAVGSWAGVATQAEASQLPQPASSNQLASVTCVTGSDCWAVGNGGEILHWNGSSWLLSPSPAGTGDLSQVACGSAKSCWALGSNLLLHWNGADWTTDSLSLPARAQLASVKCSSASNCFIVGDYGAHTRTLALHWNGAKWKRVATPNPFKNDSLTAVTCLSRADCWSLGAYLKKGDVYVFGLHWNGSRWRQRWTSQAFLPGILVEVSVNGADCTSATDCWAAGTYAATADGSSAVFFHWSGSRETSKTVVTGSAASIDCTSSSNCLAVGTTGDYIDGVSDAAFRWKGKHWNRVALPADGSGAATSLSGLSCASARDCWAVGAALGSNLALHWNGKSWTTF